MDFNWGSLYVWAPDDTYDDVIAAVRKAYEAAGLRETSLADADPMLPPLYQDPDQVLHADDVIVVKDECGWIAVMALRFEWAKPGRHPLALILSRSFEVLAVTSNANDGWAQYSVYRDGALAESTCAGAHPSPPKVPPVTLEVLASRGGFEAEDLRAVLHEPNEFVKFAGCEWTGHRAVFEAMTLDDLGAEHLLIFR